MTPVKQEFRHNPPHTFGDCHRAAVASLLGLPLRDVPHFNDAADVTEDEFNRRVSRFLAPLGLFSLTLRLGKTLDESFETMGLLYPGRYYILGGTSKNEVAHSVIAADEEIAFDPSLDDSGIVGPMDDGFYYATIIAAIHPASVVL